MSARFDASRPLRGTLRPPPDKSISHRAALLAAMAEGDSTVTEYLDAGDTRATLRALRALGAGVEVTQLRAGALEVHVRGIGLRGPAEHATRAAVRIDVANSGTLLRLLPGWLAAQPAGEWELDGDRSIRERPVDRVMQPLAAMGARVSCRDERLPPLRVAGGELRGIDYRLPVASAQVKSCVLLAGLGAVGPTTVTEPAPSRDHTERLLRGAGVPLDVEPAGTPVAVRGALPGRRIRVAPVERLQARDVEVPGDLSSAAFFLVGALLVPRSEIRLEDVGLNPTRVGVLGILSRMGASFEVEEQAAAGAEARGAITARHSRLVGTRVAAGEVPLAIDELPLVALVACFAEGETIVTGADELRHKESDRIAAVVEALRALGGDAEATDDGFVVRGSSGLRGGELATRGDHRLAMLGAIAGLASREGVVVDAMEAANVSYPRFVADLRGLLG